MNIVKDINRVRRTLFTGATNLISNHAERIEINDQSKINKILICRPNHRLGNLLLITPLIQEIESTFPAAKIDLIVKGGLAVPLFAEYASINNIYQLPKRPFLHPINYLKNYFKVTRKAYDLVINTVEESSSGRIFTKKSKGTHKLFGKPAKIYWGDKSDLKHIAKKPILALKELSGRSRGDAMPQLDLKLTLDELTKGQQILQNITNNNKQTICIFTFATGNKMHSKAWWNKLYLELRLNFSDYNIVEILPMENVSQIDFKAPTFYGREIRELGAVMAASELFLGADSGIMHLASAAHVPTLGLFNVTDIDKYRPYNNWSHAIDTNVTDHLAIISHLKSTLATKESIDAKKHFKAIA
ncbi:glycosyltransferase family 9 protein [Marinicella litoralis]|uniref:ADP-heptose:LPS heptosyltransferase n=1 Tax=Marinicella litoralis TaxID=644220 RepID=A0A4V3DHA3_9GAMM|nr:glycosyltransferase family 9 protein [Marinicella litoralis]TDR17431.1 ADP-heptose:LPS heptosyltransferase [Marinicella litoralis]